MRRDKLNLYKALSDETRYRILENLLSGEKTVQEITKHCKRAQSTTSLQLKKLENYGLVTSRREGKHMYYRIDHDKLSLVHRLL
ncbi:MAG: metalloregulator ArsR/SmtB family transcription factor [Candidatus Altiarchaeales archaeon]|nr:metalloregulator ArsR/SmtB family transcription factor [Candidatus Altiarchaeales archaeon]MBD3415949.1 metalloregulator ArsR/SmtB family transcription factor [Candidatus Altiarchaeales archaeon]